MILQIPVVTKVESEVLARTDEVRINLRHALATPKRWTGFLRRNLFARAIQGSNSIEGYNVTFADAVAAAEGDLPLDAEDQTWAAIVGYRNALTYVMQLSDDQHFTLNEELIRALHYMMLSYDPTKHPGRWRPGPIFVRHEPTGDIVYEGPDAELVSKLIHELVEQLQTHDGSVHAIVRAAMAHLNLVMIHPFSDGNGRMGRALQTLVLARGGIIDSTFSSIEEYLGSKTNAEAYYAVLAEVGQGSWHPDRDARPWLRFCLTAHLRQALTVSRRAKETAKLWNELETEIARRKLDERTILALYDAAIGLRVRSARYRANAEVSNQVASRDLRTLVAHGLLVPKGEKRGRTYVASETLVALRDRTREPRVPLLDPFASTQLTPPV
jgi:Fic family protein